MFQVISVLLGVAAIVVYVKAVRYDKKWATPVMTLLILGTVVAAILPMTGLERRMAERSAEQHRFARKRMLAEGLAPHLSDGANILLVSPEHMAKETDEFKKAFEKVAGFSVNIAETVISDRAAMNKPDAHTFNEAIAPHEDEDIDAIISLTGLPHYPDEDTGEKVYEVQKLECVDWAEPPLFAATKLGYRYDPDVLRDYIQEKLLTAILVTLEPGSEEILITSENLDDLPDTSPR